MTTILFYEGSHQFRSISTELNLHTDFIEMILAKQYEYRPTIENLWATVNKDSKEVARYKLIYGFGLAKIDLI